MEREEDRKKVSSRCMSQSRLIHHGRERDEKEEEAKRMSWVEVGGRSKPKRPNKFDSRVDVASESSLLRGSSRSSRGPALANPTGSLVSIWWE
jgi:hypothetical protein